MILISSRAKSYYPHNDENERQIMLPAILHHLDHLANNHHQFIILVYFLRYQGLASPFTSPPSTLPISCILFHKSPLSHVLYYYSIISLACLSFLILLFSTPTLLFLHLNCFCLKCSSKLSTPTLDAIAVLSTLSLDITPQIILSILLSVARSL